MLCLLLPSKSNRSKLSNFFSFNPSLVFAFPHDSYVLYHIDYTCQSINHSINLSPLAADRISICKNSHTITPNAITRPVGPTAEFKNRISSKKSSKNDFLNNDCGETAKKRTNIILTMSFNSFSGHLGDSSGHLQVVVVGQEEVLLLGRVHTFTNPAAAGGFSPDPSHPSGPIYPPFLETRQGGGVLQGFSEAMAVPSVRERAASMT